MKEVTSKKLRVEFEIVPIDESVEDKLKELLSEFLKALIRNNLINMQKHGARMSIVDITPVEWFL